MVYFMLLTVSSVILYTYINGAYTLDWVIGRAPPIIRGVRLDVFPQVIKISVNVNNIQLSRTHLPFPRNQLQM